MRWFTQPSLLAAWCSQPPRATTLMSNTVSMLFLEQFSANHGFFLVNFIITIILSLTWGTNGCSGHQNLPTTDWDTANFVRKHDFKPIYIIILSGGTHLILTRILFWFHSCFICGIWWRCRPQNPTFVSSVWPKKYEFFRLTHAGSINSFMENSTFNIDSLRILTI